MELISINRRRYLSVDAARPYGMSNALICFGVFGYIAVLLFNGLIMHFGLLFSPLETIRPILPELFLLFSLIGWFFNTKCIKNSAILAIFYVILVALLSISNFTASSFMITLRNFIIPFFLMLLLSSYSSDNISFLRLSKSLYILFFFFAAFGFIFSTIQLRNGWEWMSIYFQGYSSWGNSGKVRVIWSSWNTLRALGTTGDSATFGLYNSLAMLFMLFSKKKLSIFKIVGCLFCFGSIYNSGNKTALFISALVFLYYLLSLVFIGKERLKNKIFLITFIFAAAIGLIYSTSTSSESILYTLNIRYEIWLSIFTPSNVLNLFIPHSLFDYSSFGSSGGSTTVWDNSYLFITFSFGILGAMLFAQQIVMLIRPIWKSSFVKMIVLVLLLSMFSTNIFVGRNIGGFLLIYLGLAFSNRSPQVFR